MKPPSKISLSALSSGHGTEAGAREILAIAVSIDEQPNKASGEVAELSEDE